MRVLFTTQPAYGHFHPLVPLAHALQLGGHEVAVATSPSFAPAVERSQLQWFPAGIDWLEEANGFLRTFPQLRSINSAREGNEFVVGEIFAHLTALVVARDLRTLFEEWLPDVVIRETFEFGGALAAELRGLPHATLQVGSFGAMERWRPAAARGLAKARATLGLPEDPGLEMLYRHLLLSFVPPSFQEPEFPLPDTARVFHASVFDRSAASETPAWVAELAPQPHVLMTMGTVLSGTLPLYEVALEALTPLPLNLTLAIGNHLDPTSLGLPASNVRIERYVPLSLLLPHCDLVISHGGFGTVMAALAHGLPMVLIPRAADQHDNSRRCAALGVAKVIESETPTLGELRSAAQEVLGSPSFRRRAEAMRDEMLSLAGLEEAVETLEQLGARSPIRLEGPTHPHGP